MKLNALFVVTLGMLLLAMVGVVIVKMTGLSPVYSAICILLIFILSLGMVFIRMAVTRKAKAKGAKKRREKLLPMFYKKKKRKKPK